MCYLSGQFVFRWFVVMAILSSTYAQLIPTLGPLHLCSFYLKYSSSDLSGASSLWSQCYRSPAWPLYLILPTSYPSPPTNIFFIILLYFLHSTINSSNVYLGDYLFNILLLPYCKLLENRDLAIVNTPVILKFRQISPAQ